MALIYRLVIFLALCVVSVSPGTTSTARTTTSTPPTTTSIHTTTTTTTRSPGTAPPGNPATSGGATGAPGRPGISNCGLGCKLGLPRQSFNFGNPNFRGMGSGGSIPGAGLHGTLQCFAFSVVATFVHFTLC